MKEAFLNTPDDMQWLREVHWPTLPPEYKSALITGNEDAPEAIAAFVDVDPLITDTPLMWTPPSTEEEIL